MPVQGMILTDLTMGRVVLDQEVADFKIEDLFMSRTDERGVIQAANTTFQRLAGYEWAQLLGAPHKIIRHPDMPKGVFQLFWDRLQSGKSIGAYVKNRAKDGRYYWVFAIALPVADGYVSVRLKPSSKEFATVRALYDALLKAERDENLTPAQSAERMRDMLRKHGYANYREAMASWLRAEISARRAGLGRRPDPVLKGLEDLRGCVGRIGKELANVRTVFESIRGTPTNLRIQASRFGAVAITIQIISQNYDLLTKEIEAANGIMDKVYDQLMEIIDDDSFSLSSVSLLNEAFTRFSSEKGLPSNLSMAEETRIIRPHTEGVRASGELMVKKTEELVEQVLQLQRTVSGLALTRVMCRIEAAGLSGDAGGIADIVDRLLEFQKQVVESIENIDKECRDAHRMMGKLTISFSETPDERQPRNGVERRKKPREDRNARPAA